MHLARLVVMLAAVSIAAVAAPFAAAEGAPAVTGVTVTFSEAVDVTGAPGLSIDMDPAHWGEKRAVYASGSGTVSLVFAHEVVQPNYSTRGIAVLADTLSLDGGAIRSASSGADAALGHGGLAHDAAHKVDWGLSPRDTTPPELVRGEVDGSTMRLTFSEALDEGATGGRFFVDLVQDTPTVGFAAAGPVTIDGAVVTVGLGAGNPRAQAGRLDGNRVLYVRRADGAGGALRDLAGNPVVAPHVMPYSGGETWRGSEEWRYVRIALDNVTEPPPDTVPPELVRGEINGGTVTLWFSEALDPEAKAGRFHVQVQPSADRMQSFDAAGDVAIDGNRVTVGVGEGKPRARAGLTELNYAHYIAPLDPAAAGLRDLAGNPVATPLAFYGGERGTRAVKLNNVTVATPAVTEVEVTSDAGADATYAPGETVRVTLTFSEEVAVTGAPRLKLALGSGDERWAVYRSGGGTAMLAFAYSVAQGDASAGVAVLADTLALNGGTIRSAASGRDAALAHTGLAHDAAHKVDGAPDTTPPRLSRTVVDGTELTLAFDEAIDAAASLTNGAYTVKKTPQGGSEETMGLSGTPAVEGAEVTLTLATAVRDTDTDVKVSYRKPASDAGDRLRDKAGNEVAAFNNQPVTNNAPDTTPPTLVRGEIHGATVTLYFSEALDEDSVEGYFGVTVGTNSLSSTQFRATGGIKINGNVVTVGVGQGNPRARAGLDGNFARYHGPVDPSAGGLRDLAGNPVKAQRAVLLDNLTGPPTVSAVRITSDAGADQTYGPGDTIRVRLWFNAPVAVTGAPRLKIDFSSGAGDEKWAVYASGSGTRWPEFAYTVAQRDGLSAGVAVLANTLELDGGTIESAAAAGENAALAHQGRPHNASHKVDARPPPLSLASVNGATLRLTFDKALGAATSLANGAFAVKKTPQGGSEQTVSLSGSPAISGATVTLTLADAVLATDTDVKVSYVKPTSGTGNRLKDAAGNEVAGFTDEPVTNVTGDTTPPWLVGGEIDGGTVTLYFSEALDPDSVGGWYQMDIVWGPTGCRTRATGDVEIDGSTVTFGLSGGCRANAYTTRSVFWYIWPTDSTTGLRDLAGNEVWGIPRIALHNTTGAGPTPPSVIGVAFSSDAGNDDRYVLGETIRVRLTFSKAVAVAGTPRVKLDFGSGDEKWADYASGSSTPLLEFAYEVAQGDLSTQGVAVLADTLELNGGTIRSASAQNAMLAHAGLDHDPNHKVDGKPHVTRVAFSSDAGDDATYTPGETVVVTLTFSEAVAVTGAPRLKLDLGFGDERWAVYASGSGTKMLEFAYTVAQGDASSAGVVVLANTLELDDGTIRSAAAGENANLAHAGLDHDPNHRVDAMPPTLSAARVGGATLTLTFSEALGAAASLANGAFTVKKTPQGGNEQTVSLSGTPAIDGATVTLTLANAVLETDTDVKVSYTRPTSGTGNRLRDEAGNGVASFSDESVKNIAADTSPLELERGEIDGGTVTLYFSEALDPDSMGGAFRVNVRRENGWRYITDIEGDMEISGNAVTVGLGSWGETQVRAKAGDQSNFAFYHQSTDPTAKSLRDLAGNPVRTPRSWGNERLRTRFIYLDNLTGVTLLSVADARANEGAGAAVAFEVSLNRAAAGAVTVDYATADGTAQAGADYTATSGTLTFAAGETAKTVRVPVLDDAVDEGEETFTLRLSNATGARIADGEAVGTIVNDDPLQKMWLSRFGRTVASHVTDAVSDRLAAPLSGAELSVGGQRVDLAQAEDGAALAQALTGLARLLGANEGPAPGDGPDGYGASGWPETRPGVREPSAAGGAPGRRMSGREVLLGSAFHLARDGDGAGPGLAAWGRVTVGGFDGEAPTDGGSVRIDGEVATGILGADAEWNRLLAGVALSVSEGEGGFDQPGVDSGTIESTMTTVSPYARFMVNDRVSAWGLVGYGSGDMTIVQAANERGQPERVTRSDLGMRLAALGGRGALLEADESGGMELGLKADAFWVETEAGAVSNEGGTTAVASRVRLVLEGSRVFRMEGGGSLTPGVELGLRHDGGDAETGTGVELGGRVAWEDPEMGLGVEARVRTLVAHEDSEYREWGASGAVRLAPGERGRGLSFRLSPTWGSVSSGMDRLWSARDARGLAPGAGFEAGRRLEGELGYGLGLFGDRFTGTPNVGFGLSDSAREVRIGWRLTPAARGDSGFELNLDATRRESAGADAPEHGVMLRGALRF